MPTRTVLTNGSIFTANPEALFVDSVTVEGERIVAIGEAPQSADLVIDLAGRMVTPGFIDAHVHPAMSGLDKLRINFDGVEDAASAFRVISEYTQTHPDEPWIIGSGWSQGWFDRGCPSREMLDRLVPDRPALISNTDGHGAWANSVALNLAGIGATTPDPDDGRIERNSDGTAQGTLHEGAIDLVGRLAPPDTVDDLERGLVRGQQELLGYGITGWQDAIVHPEIQEAYLRLAGDGRLKGRVVGALWWDRERGMAQIDELVERRRNGGHRFRPTSVKLMLDGVAENFTAAMLAPYLDDSGQPTDNAGIDFLDRTELVEIVTRLDALGFQCHFHALGDRAVRNALDAIEAAQASNGASDLRHHIAHIQVVDPADYPRFAALGAVANAQPLWACHDTYQDELTIPFLGERRAALQYPFASLLRAGARMGMGSDWGVSTANVMEEIAVATTRSGGDREPFYPSEILTPVEALTAFTKGSAYINHAEGDTGTLAVGMLADLVILDRDPMRDGFREARVELTMIGGEVVYEES